MPKARCLLTAKSAIGALALVCLMLVAGLAGWWSADWKTQSEAAAPQEVDFYLLDNGFHTDLAVPRRLLTAHDDALAEATAQSGDGNWFLVGWGDSRFYQEQGRVRDRIPDGLRALFTPGGSPAVIRFIPVQVQDGHEFPYEGKAFSLALPQALALRQRLSQSLLIEAGQPMPATDFSADIPYEATFWRSKERFSVLHLCNHWMADVLHRGGMTVPVGRAMVSRELTLAVERHNEGRTGLERPQ